MTLNKDYPAKGRPLPPLEIGGLARWLHGVAATLLVSWLVSATYVLLADTSLDQGGARAPLALPLTELGQSAPASSAPAANMQVPAPSVPLKPAPAGP
jgi:hypothetical protein